MKRIMTIVFCVAGLCACAQNTKPGLTILPPSVLYGGFSDDNLLKRLRDSVFDATVSPEDYMRSTRFENQLESGIIFNYSYYLKKYYNLHFLRLSEEDSTTVANEMKKMKLTKIDSSETINIPSAVDKVLSKYSIEDSAILITTVTDYYRSQAYGYRRAKPVAFTLTEIFVIDAQKRNIIFYKNKLTKWLGIPGGILGVDIKRTLKGLLKKQQAK